jgi:TrmH RNA methyltransferase
VKRVREIPVCGWKSVAAVFARRPECVRRLFFDPATGRRAGDFSKYLAKERRIYRQVEPEELEKVAGTVHHGGIVAITERAEPAEITPPEIAAWAKERRPLLVLDRVANHHNLGALIRTAAFFGVRAVVYGAHPDQALPGESTYRIAEGGMEFVELRPTSTLPRFLRAIRPQYATVGAALQGEPLERAPVAAGPGARPGALSRFCGRACATVVRRSWHPHRARARLSRLIRGLAPWGRATRLRRHALRALRPQRPGCARRRRLVRCASGFHDRPGRRRAAVHAVSR